MNEAHQAKLAQQAQWEAFGAGALVGACEVFRACAPPGLWPLGHVVEAFMRWKGRALDSRP